MFYLFYRIYGHFVFRSPQPPPWGRTTGAVRPEDYPHREGCVRDKWEAQKPTTALASGLNRRILAWSGKRTLCRRSVKKRGRFACKPASGARFSTAKCRSRESDMRMVLRRFCHQKYNKSSKRANKRSGIDNQAVFRFGSPCRSFRMASRRHRRTRVRFPKRYLVRECLSFHKTVIFRLLHFCSS